MKILSTFLFLFSLTFGLSQSDYERLVVDANSGELNAKYDLALLLMDGDTEHEDTAKAMELLLESADLELWESLVMLGDIYKHGKTGEKDATKAYQWYSKGAKSGSKICQLETGVALINGAGVEPNAEEGFIWVSKSAEQGLKDALIQQYRCYRDGLGVKQSGKKGLSILRELAESGYPLAQIEMGYLYANGNLVKEKDLSEAYKWYEKAALQGDARGQFEIGLAHRSGNSPNNDHENNHLSAFLWFEKAAKQGHYEAMSYVGFYHLYGDRGIDKNVEAALNTFKTLQKAKQADGNFGMALCYKNGEGVEQNNDTYKELLEKAAKGGSVRACMYYAALLEQGEEYEKNLEKAFTLYLFAAESGERMAYQKVAVMYCHAKGTEENIEECAAWRKRAYDEKIPDMDGITTKYELEKYWK